MRRHNCESCPFRVKYDRAPKSVMGRIRRRHIDFCPGRKGYFKDRTPERQTELREQYYFTKY